MSAWLWISSQVFVACLIGGVLGGAIGGFASAHLTMRRIRNPRPRLRGVHS